MVGPWGRAGELGTARAGVGVARGQSVACVERTAAAEPGVRAVQRAIGAGEGEDEGEGARAAKSPVCNGDYNSIVMVKV